MADKDQRIVPAATWDAAARYTASGDTDIIVTNSTNDRTGDAYWLRTDDNTPPTLEVEEGHKIVPGASQGIKLLDGERIWFAGEYSRITLGD